MADRRIGVIINGATGRMGTTQHMAHLLAIAVEGGLKLKNGDRLIPELMLVGRDAKRMAALAAAQAAAEQARKEAEASKAAAAQAKADAEREVARKETEAARARAEAEVHEARERAHQER